MRSQGRRSARSRVFGLFGKSALVIALMAAVLVIAPVSALADADDNIAGAVAVPFGGANGTLTEFDDEYDVYWVELAVGQTIRATLTGAAGTDFDLYAFGPDATDIFTDVELDASNGLEYPEIVQLTATAAGRHYFAVKDWMGTGTYSLDCEFVTISDEGDDNISGALELTGGVASGSLTETTDLNDVYYVDLTAGQTVYLNLDGALGTDFDLYVYGPTASDINVNEEISVSALSTYPEQLRLTAPTAGRYYLDVRHYSGTGTYTLTSETLVPAADDLMPGVAITPSPISGTLDEFTDPDDVYYLDVTEGQTIRLSLTGSAESAYMLYLYPPGSTSYDDPYAAASDGVGYPEVIEYTIPAGQGGRYYVDAYSMGGSGSYTLTWSLVTLKNISACTIAAIADQTYSGSAITPAITVTDGATTLVKDTDYTVAYSNNVAVGTATITITGKGAYVGTKTATFAIVDKTAPVTTIGGISAGGSYPGSAAFTLSATDVGAGGVTTYYTIDGGTQQTYSKGVSVTALGAHTLSYWSVDGAGNTETAHNVSFTVTQATTVMPVYRFYNKVNGSHFYTASEDERDMVISRWPNIFNLDGVVYTINTSNPNNNAPLYRFYNKKNGSHFYTAYAEEREIVLSRWSDTYQLDGPAYNVCTSSVAGAAPVYRFYNKKNGSHFYTASEDERDMVIRTWPETFTLDGAAFWIAQ